MRAHLRIQLLGRALACVACIAASPACTTSSPQTPLAGGRDSVPQGRALESVSAQGLHLRLIADRFYTAQCEWLDSSASIAFPCGPNPYSRACVLLSVRSPANASVELVSQGGEVLAQFELQNVVAGDYRLEVDQPIAAADPFFVRISEGGRVVGQTVYPLFRNLGE